MKDSLIEGNKIVIDKTDEILSEYFKQNKDFNDYYDSNVSVLTSDDNKEIIKFASIDDVDDYEVSATPSMILFFNDREKYISELEAWKRCELKNYYNNVLEWLNKEDLLVAFYEMVQAIKRNKIAPFIGAGVSSNLKVPTWGNALRELTKQLYTRKNNKIEELIDSYNYLEAAEILYKKNPQAFINLVEDKFTINPNWTKIDFQKGVLKYLPSLSNGCVITTNFDRILEKHYKYSESSFEGFMYGSQADNSFVTDLIEGGRCLLKLHGNANQKKTFVFTESQYKKAYGDPISFKNELPRTLRQIFISHSLLFLGCSLEQDKTLELFKLVKDSREYQIPKHFAILNSPISKSERNRKRDYLRSLNIRVIWYPNDKHSYVEDILKLAMDIAFNNLSI